MTILTPESMYGPGTLLELAADQSVFVGKNVALVSTSGHVIQAAGSDHSVTVEGTVIADFFGIVLGASSSTFTGNSITIGETGRVMGLGTLGGGIGCYGFDARVVNHGYVEGTRYGIGFYNDSTTTDSTLINSGIIKAGNLAVYRDGSSTTETIMVKNSGRIESDATAYGSITGVHIARDLITNTGVMIGDILLGHGGDRYDGRDGRVAGDVSGGAGKDQLLGGKEANVFLGDAGLDKLTGARGADQLMGGTDSDHFIYKSIRDSSTDPNGRDTITDFNQIEADLVDLEAIDANAKVGGNQKFDFIGEAAFHGKAGELRYIIVNGQTLVQGDTNGDKKADFAILLDDQVALGAGDFVL